ncbi:MAG: esterase family protein, partial [Bacteroidetes bacterium]|nr:esterase family protein [Bacteroidota bacterium]
MKYLFLPLLLLATHAFAARVDTILVHSGAMNKDIKCVVIQPEHAPTTKTSTNSTRFPVVFLLHGHSGNYAQWPATAPQLKKEADDLGILFICPDGGFDSWYFDSPIDPTVRYETFMTKEL